MNIFFHIYFEFFNKIYLDHSVFPSPTSFQILLPPPTQLYLLSISIPKKSKQKAQTKNEYKQQQNNPIW